MRRKKGGALKAIFILLLLAVFAFAGLFVYENFFKEGASHTIVVPTVTKEPVNSIEEKTTSVAGTTIQSGLRDIGKLVTEEYFFTHVEDFKSAKQVHGFEIPLTKSSYLYSYDGTIQAGVNFAKISVDKNDTDKTVVITVPKAEITSVEIDEDSFKVYDEKSNIFNPIKLEDFNKSQDDLKQYEKDNAVKKGVLEKAQNNAGVLIKNFVMSTYDLKGYKVDVKTAE